MTYSLKTQSLLLLLVAFFPFRAHAQEISIKSNLPSWFTATTNIGFEYAFGENISMELSAGINPFTKGDERRMEHWVVWPEVRYWMSDNFDGSFFGVHGVGGRCDIGGVKMPFNTLKGLRDKPPRGGAVGFGFSYGYKWFFSDSWAIEATAGFGFVRFSYDLYSLGKDSSKTGEDKKEYAGPSKAAISIVYTIR